MEFLMIDLIDTHYYCAQILDCVYFVMAGEEAMQPLLRNLPR